MINWQKFSQMPLVLVLGAGLLMLLLNMNHSFHSALLNVDMQVAIKLNSILGVNPLLDETLAWASTRLGDAFVFTCLLLLLFVHALQGGNHNETIKRLSYWLWLGALALIVYGISCGTEFFIRRNTPIHSIQHFYNLQTIYGIMLHSCPTSSFPSGHGIAYLFFAMMAFQRYFRMSLILWCIAVVMLSVRLIVGLHWLSDIIFGSLFLSALLMTLISDTALKGSYKYSEQVVSQVFARLFLWRNRFCEIILQPGKRRSIN